MANDFRELLLAYRFTEAGIAPQLTPVRPLIELRRNIEASRKAIAERVAEELTR